MPGWSDPALDAATYREDKVIGIVRELHKRLRSLACNDTDVSTDYSFSSNLSCPHLQFSLELRAYYALPRLSRRWQVPRNLMYITPEPNIAFSPLNRTTSSAATWRKFKSCDFHT